jgi:hypothetical protein
MGEEGGEKELGLDTEKFWNYKPLSILTLTMKGEYS